MALQERAQSQTLHKRPVEIMVTSLEVSNLDNLFEMVDLVSHCALNQNQIKLNPNQKTCVIEKVNCVKRKMLV